LVGHAHPANEIFLYLIYRQGMNLEGSRRDMASLLDILHYAFFLIFGLIARVDNFRFDMAAWHQSNASLWASLSLSIWRFV